MPKPQEHATGYAFAFQDATFTPDGKANITDTDAHNREIEANEIRLIQAGAVRLFLYIGHKPMTTLGVHPAHFYSVQTWLGTWLGWARLGQRIRTGFGYQTYRRAVTVRMFGTLYHGWYTESSGDYCRLRKAKKQDAKYTATPLALPAEGENR